MYNFLSWLGMAETHEERAVANYKDTQNLVEFDTCLVTDFPDTPYETGMVHPSYNGGKWVIVEAYKTKEEAQAGHDKWVQLYASGNLPKEISDCRKSDFIAAFIAAMFGDEKE